MQHTSPRLKSRGYVAFNFSPNAAYTNQGHARKPQHLWSPQHLTQDTHESLSITTDYNMLEEDWHSPRPWSDSSSHTPSPTPPSTIVDVEIVEPDCNNIEDIVMHSSFQCAAYVPSNFYMDGYAFENISGMDMGMNGPGATSSHLSNVPPGPNAMGIVNPSIPGVHNRVTNDGSHTPTRLVAHRDTLRDSHSHSNSLNFSDAEDTILAVSTAFNPDSRPQLPSTDVVLVSADQVLFYVHSNVLVAAAPQAFRHLLANNSDAAAPSPNPTLNTAVPVQLHATSLPGTCLKLDAFPADELNIVLHAFYNTSSAAHNPSIAMLENSIDKMPRLLRVPPKQLITPQTELFSLLLGLAPLHPLKIYALSARHNIHDLAVRASSHLLSYPLSSLTDEASERIGAVYLKKLALLHVERESKLREVLLKPPRPHPPSKKCGFAEQKVLEGMWASGVVGLAWDTSPDFSTATLQRTLDPLMESLDCRLCRKSLETRIKDVMTTWASVKRTI